jgi:FADH2 O2-dependent halogenase
VGDLTGDQAADIIFKVIKDCDSLGPSLGWQDENHRFMHPTTREIAKFMYWGMRKAPEGEVRDMTRAIFANSVRSALKGKKPR